MALVATDQTRTAVSFPARRQSLAVGGKGQRHDCSRVALQDRISLVAARASQSSILPSIVPHASVAPSGENATVIAPVSRPPLVSSIRPVEMSQSATPTSRMPSRACGRRWSMPHIELTGNCLAAQARGSGCSLRPNVPYPRHPIRVAGGPGPGCPVRTRRCLPAGATTEQYRALFVASPLPRSLCCDPCSPLRQDWPSAKTQQWTSLRWPESCAALSRHPHPTS